MRFYLGDPNSGGVLLENISGETEVFTNQAIPARGTETVQFIWAVNNGTGTFPRVYAVIDADNQLVEIHKNNNKSWAILNKSTTTDIEEGEDENMQFKYKLFQNYPNPFYHKTTIRYNIEESTRVDLSVFDIMGRKVETLVSENQPVGNYRVEWDAGRLKSGIYFYKLETANGFVQSRKLVLY